MKRFLLGLFALVGMLCASAQDIIVKSDGSTVMCRIVEVNGTDVVYLKWSDLNGPRYVMDRSVVANINYQDGRQDKINKQTSNAYAPGNQQTGSSNYNDNALISLDRSRRYTAPMLKKAKTLKIIGLTVGPALTVAGAVLMGLEASYGWDSSATSAFIGGAVVCAAGIATTTGCLIKASQLKREYSEVSCAPLIQHQIAFGNGSRLTAGVDLIRDNRFKESTFGMGLKYNF